MSFLNGLVSSLNKILGDFSKVTSKSATKLR